MSRPVSLTISHSLGQTEAQRRIQSGIDQFKTSMGGMAKVTHERWTDHVLEFGIAAMGQRCEGKITVNEQSVDMELMLPTLLAMAADRILAKVQSKGKILLGNKPSSSA